MFLAKLYISDTQNEYYENHYFIQLVSRQEENEMMF